MASSPATIAKSQKPITPIKILNRNTVLKTTNTSDLQYDNVNDENNDSVDWITVEPKSPNANKILKTSPGLCPKQKQSTSTHLRQLNK